MNANDHPENKMKAKLNQKRRMKAKLWHKNCKKIKVEFTIISLGTKCTSIYARYRVKKPPLHRFRKYSSSL